MQRHGGLAGLVAGELPHGENAIALTDTVLGCLRATDLSPCAPPGATTR
ncbi:hypothetical protein ACFYOD_33220 [Streptomyces sp. NPDC006703]